MKASTITAFAAFAAALLSGPPLAGTGGIGLAGVRLADVRLAAAAEALAFVEGVGDVPAMPGLAPVVDSGLVFDKPVGRIAEAVLSGPVTRDAVQAFYARALPPLGWAPLAVGRFRREGEELRLEFVDPRPHRPGTTTVRFVVTPR